PTSPRTPRDFWPDLGTLNRAHLPPGAWLLFCSLPLHSLLLLGRCISLQRLTDFPMVSEGIHNSSDAPTIWLILNRSNHGRSCFYGATESRVRVLDHHHQPYRTASQILGAEIQVLRRLVCHPEFLPPNGEPSDHGPPLAAN